LVFIPEVASSGLLSQGMYPSSPGSGRSLPWSSSHRAMRECRQVPHCLCAEPYSRIISRNALRFFVFDQSPSSIFAPYFPDGNALRFLYRTHEMRKPKTRNASRFRWLTLVQFNLTTPDIKKKYKKNFHYRVLLKLTCFFTI
jgi:hypothetical protein